MSALKLKARGFRWVPILVLYAYTGAYSEPITKVYGPNCSTEVTREIENGSIVNEKITEKCTESSRTGKQEFDPENDPNDALLFESIRLAMYAAFVKIVGE